MRLTPTLSCCLVTLLACCASFGQASKPGGAATYDGQSSAVWLTRLKDPDDAVRIRAAYALGQINPPAPQTVPALIKSVDDRAQEVRWYSAASLGRLGPVAKAGVAVLIAGVKDPANDKPFSLAAAQSFGRIGPAAEEAVPWLVEALNDPHPPLRVAAALALWRIKRYEGSLPALAAALAEPGDEGSYLAGMALLELGADARPAAGALVKTLGHNSADARRAAARVLGKLGSDMIVPLSKALSGALQTDSQRESGLTALAYLLGKERLTVLYNPRATPDEFAAAEQRCLEAALPVLIQLFGDSHEDVRLAAARTAANIGTPAIPALLAALSEGNDQIRAAAADALARLEGELPQGAPAPQLAPLQDRLIAPFVVALKHADSAVRAPALRMFARLTWGPEAQAAVPLLRDALKSEDPRVRRHAAKALEQVGKGAVEPTGGAANPR